MEHNYDSTMYELTEAYREETGMSKDEAYLWRSNRSKKDMLKIPNLRQWRKQRTGFVYFLVNGEEVVYVGQTKRTVFSRTKSHAKDKVYDSVFYVECPVCDLMSTEMSYIRQFRPKYNATHNMYNSNRNRHKLKIPKMPKGS